MASRCCIPRQQRLVFTFLRRPHGLREPPAARRGTAYGDAVASQPSGTLSRTAPERRVPALFVALGLFAGSLALLRLGQFIQFNDTSGFGADEWILPLGVLAGLAAIASVIVAAGDRTALRLLGAALLALDALLIWQAATNDGFRFIWTTYEGELILLQIALGMTGLLLVASRSTRQPDTSTATRAAAQAKVWVPVPIHLGASALVTLVAFGLGTAHFQSTQCGGPDFDGECDLAGLEGMVWAAAAIGLMTLAGIVIFIVAHVRKSRARR
jgi:hypothetical protein